MGSTPPDVRFRILGAIAVTSADGSAQVRGRRQVALLAFLLLRANRVVTTDQLIDALWSDQPATGALKRLQVAVTRLRTALDGSGEALQTVGGGYLFAVEPGELDADLFRTRLREAQSSLDAGRPAVAAAALREGLAMWRGPPLAEVAYADFAQAEIRQLDELRLNAVELALDADLACGRHREVLAEIETLMAEQPLRERPRAQRMLALYRSGRQAEALEAFHELRRTLIAELGIEPGPDVRGLHQAILRQDPSLDVAPAATPAELPARLSTARRQRFVGRRREREILEAALAAAGDGEPGVVLLAGEPGIGKTSLAARAAERARELDFGVLYGYCDEELGIAYQPLRLALDQYLEWAPDELLERHVAEHGGRLSHLTPVLAQRVAVDAPPRLSDPESERWLLFQAVAGLLAQAAANRPLVLILDDLHWADRLTVALLRHVIGAVVHGGLLVLATYRSTEVSDDHPLRALTTDLGRVPGTIQIDLGGLGEADIVALVEAHGQDPERVARDLRRDSGGNPFFVVELLRHSGQDTPRSVRDVIVRRAGRLGSRAQELLAGAAVIGRDFDVELLQRVTAADEAELAASLDAAARAALIHPAPFGRFTFVHELIPSSLYGGLGEAERGRLHRRVFAELEHTGVPVTTLAHHAVAGAQASTAPVAVGYASAAGDAALESLAPDEALRWYRRALDVHDELAPRADGRGDSSSGSGALSGKRASQGFARRCSRPRPGPRPAATRRVWSTPRAGTVADSCRPRWRPTRSGSRCSSARSTRSEAATAERAPSC